MPREKTLPPKLKFQSTSILCILEADNDDRSPTMRCVFLTTTTNRHLPRADNPTRLCTLPWKHRWKFRALSYLTT